MKHTASKRFWQCLDALPSDVQALAHRNYAQFKTDPAHPSLHFKTVGGGQYHSVRVGRSIVDLVPVDGKLGRAGGAAPGKEARNLDYFCFRVEPFDKPSIRLHLEAQGIEVGPVASRYGVEGEGPSIYVTDPEGNVVELKCPPGG